MFITAITGENLIKTFTWKNILFELVRCPSTIWCGTLGYAANCTDEPDIEGLLKKYQSQCHIPKKELANPAWSGCISINYWQNGAVPRGMIFMQQVLTEEQDPVHDVYTMPQSLYIRAACTPETAKAAFDRNECGVWELFGLIKEVMDTEGYSIGTNGAQEIEMYGPGTAYAYVQVQVQI